MITAKRLIKIVLRLTVTTVLIWMLYTNPTYAQTLDFEKEDLSFPQVELSAEENLGRPESIYLVPFTAEISSPINDIDWYKGVYYYQAFRLGQGDLLFHYYMSKSGELFPGNDFGEEQRFALKENTDNPVIIAYYAGSDNKFTDQARAELGPLLLDIANKNRIPLEQIYIKTLSYEVTENNELIGVADDAISSWRNELDQILKVIADEYNPESFTFELEVVDVRVPETGVDYGDNVVVGISLKNNSAISLYQGTDAEPIIAKTEGDFSNFFINNIWLTPTQSQLMPEGTVIRSGETKEFQVRLGVPLAFGTQSEVFQLQNSLGEVYPDSEFTIALGVNRTEQEVVEILSTSVGYLNVRSEPTTSSEQVSRVSPGQRFLVLERSGGWVKIDLQNGESGWVSSTYTRVI